MFIDEMNPYEKSLCTVMIESPFFKSGFSQDLNPIEISLSDFICRSRASASHLSLLISASVFMKNVRGYSYLQMGEESHRSFLKLTFMAFYTLEFAAFGTYEMIYCVLAVPVGIDLYGFPYFPLMETTDFLK